MRSVFNSNVVAIGVLGVLLLLASAVGRVTATNLHGWLAGATSGGGRVVAQGPAFMDGTARTPSPWR